jgi:hypothetical protein
MIIQDWERAAVKDRIYIEEEQELLRQELQEELRRPAIISVIDKDKVLRNEYNHNALPF